MLHTNRTLTLVKGPCGSSFPQNYTVARSTRTDTVVAHQHPLPPFLLTEP